MAAVTIDTVPAADPSLGGPVPVRSAGPAVADRSPTTARPDRTVPSWPLLVLAAPAVAEVWFGWVGIGQKTGFGLVRPLPGIWPSLHLDTGITLPIGVEAYAAYALRAWLAASHAQRPDPPVRQVVGDLLVRAGDGRAGRLPPDGPGRGDASAVGGHDAVSCLPVLVLAMATALAHMLRADAEDTGTPDSRTGQPANLRSLPWSPEDQGGTGPRGPAAGRDRSARRDRTVPTQDHATAMRPRDLVSAPHRHSWIRPA